MSVQVHINNLGISTNSDICPLVHWLYEACFVLCPSRLLITYPAFFSRVSEISLVVGWLRNQGYPDRTCCQTLCTASEVNRPISMIPPLTTRYQHSPASELAFLSVSLHHTSPYRPV